MFEFKITEIKKMEIVDIPVGGIIHLIKKYRARLIKTPYGWQMFHGSLINVTNSKSIHLPERFKDDEDYHFIGVAKSAL